MTRIKCYVLSNTIEVNNVRVVELDANDKLLFSDGVTVKYFDTGSCMAICEKASFWINETRDEVVISDFVNGEVGHYTVDAAFGDIRESVKIAM